MSDRDGLDLSVLKEVHSAPVGEVGHRERGQALKRGLDVEGLSQELAGPGQVVQVLPHPALGRVQPRPLERVGGLLHGPQEKRALLRGEAASFQEAKRDGAENPAMHRQWHERPGPRAEFDIDELRVAAQ